MILRPEEKTEAATAAAAAAAAADSAAESRPSSGPACAGELFRNELQLSRGEENMVSHTTYNNNIDFDYFQVPFATNTSLISNCISSP